MGDDVFRLGTSMTQVEARATVVALAQVIRTADVQIPVVTRVIDWGAMSSQGRRRGHTVKGAMAARLGKQTYEGVDYSAYPELREHLKTYKMGLNEITLYVKARLVGANHLEGMVYGILKPGFDSDFA